MKVQLSEQYELWGEALMPRPASPGKGKATPRRRKGGRLLGFLALALGALLGGAGAVVCEHLPSSTAASEGGLGSASVPPPMQMNYTSHATSHAESLPASEIAGPSLPPADEVDAAGEEKLPAAAPPAPANGSIHLEMEPVWQNPELPNGCEATSLAALLRYHGFDACKLEMAYQYIPRQDFSTVGGERTGPDPNEAYAGDPATRTGFYCLAPAAVAGANQYLAERQSALHGEEVSGLGREALNEYLRGGHPVMLWVTLAYDDVPQYLGYTWRLPNGELYTPYANLHCVVVHGLEDGCYRVCDPLQGELLVDVDALLASNAALGGDAVVIL